ncbi:unnamed protein product [Cyberlindnera jadinii]|uniref:Uncharacterized protein n=1 Tax=Cyberlindnera jadinii (strain ATCC 18201 / CBS 1600 / BCRC 20928 / JCM 3617 / NBRC 0987 / NRRL Y-1542) TaxID=983966 RepID=A0A0H5C586_CYBJN|nr:unnamed protein product [Cyberlindnera jadinii]
MSTNSTVNTKSAFGGITPPAPLEPYPNSGGIVSLRFSPMHIPKIPWSQPLMTLPVPNGKVIGSPRDNDESNTVPSDFRDPV